MAIATVFMGSLLLYGKSKYFPENLIYLQNLLSRNIVLTRIFGYVLLAISAFLFSHQYDIATGVIVFLAALLLTISLLVIALPIHRNFIYLFGSIGLLSMVINYFI